MRLEEPRDKALEICRDLSQSYKVEHIQEGLADDPTLSFYQQGEFLDFAVGLTFPAPRPSGPSNCCRSQVRIGKAIRLAQTTATTSTELPSSTSKDLDQHLQRIEEAKRRDHRVLGKQLELFTPSTRLSGPGSSCGCPRAALVRGMLENFVREELTRRGYQAVYTPNIGRVELYETSGHYPYYSDSMFTPIVMEATRNSTSSNR